MALQRIIPDYTAALEVGTEGACEDGSCEPEKEVEASTDFAQCARDGAKDCGVMPTLQASQWLNTLGQPSGTVTLVDFWSSSCTNCQREIPELEAIYEKYKSYGLVVVGVHSPQQAFERDASVVNASISKLGRPYRTDRQTRLSLAARGSLLRLRPADERMPHVLSLVSLTGSRSQLLRR